MKCPYRVQVNKTVTLTGSVNSVRENVEYADCYEDECPFYNSYAENCGRVIQETGGDL